MSTDEPSPLPARRYGGLSAEERLERRRSQLLDAGLETFGTIGYRAATARGICQAAGLTDRYFHESFASMEDLLIAVYEREIARLRDLVTDTFTRRSPEGIEDIVRALLDAHFTFARDPKVARLVWLEVLGVGPRTDQAYVGAMRHFIGFVLMLLTSNPEAARFAAKVPLEEIRVLATGFIGAIDQTTRLWLLEDYATPHQVLVDGLTRMLLLGTVPI